MTPDQEALSHLAVSYLTRLEVQGRIGSRWLCGMEVVLPEGGTWQIHHLPSPMTRFPLNPDHPLTVQALLLLFREASGDEGAYVRTRKGGPKSVKPWALYSVVLDPNRSGYGPVASGDTEAHALVNGFKVLLDEGTS